MARANQAAPRRGIINVKNMRSCSRLTSVAYFFFFYDFPHTLYNIFMREGIFDEGAKRVHLIYHAQLLLS